VVVNGDGQFLLGLILADNVFVEERLDLERLGQMRGSRAGGSLRAVVFEDRVANSNALVADIRARIVAG